MNTSYALDKSNAKMLGVCAGLARTIGWDPLAVRVGAVAATLLLLGPVAIVLYLVTALLAESR
ncbi:MAG TPA: PspC domain-containing protein [Allosphingosinicella sp.]|nr:PspC domain-containing protein [Allosphingosinicella sp.]